MTHFTGGINQPVERFAGWFLSLPHVRSTIHGADDDPNSDASEYTKGLRIAAILRQKTSMDTLKEEFSVLEKRVGVDLTSKIMNVPALASNATSASEEKQEDLLQSLDVWFRCSMCERSMPPWKIYAHACFVYDLKPAAGRKLRLKEGSIVGWSPERLTLDLHAIDIHNSLRTIVERACRVDLCSPSSGLEETVPDRKPFPFSHETLCTTEWHFRCQFPKCSGASSPWSSIKFVSNSCMGSSHLISVDVPFTPIVMAIPRVFRYPILPTISEPESV